MGGARKAGRWFDKRVLQTTGGQVGLGLLTGGMSVLPTLAYNATRARDMSSPLPPMPGAPPDITDQAIRMARERERRRQSGGGRRSSFLTGALGDTGAVSSTVQKLIGS